MQIHVLLTWNIMDLFIYQQERYICRKCDFQFLSQEWHSSCQAWIRSVVHIVKPENGSLMANSLKAIYWFLASFVCRDLNAFKGMRRLSYSLLFASRLQFVGVPVIKASWNIEEMICSKWMHFIRLMWSVFYDLQSGSRSVQLKGWFLFFFEIFLCIANTR